MKQKIIFAGLALLLAGCASVKTGSNRFVVERRWARSTLDEVYLRNRRMHRSTPVLNDKMIIAANAIDGVVAYSRSSAAELWRLDIAHGVSGELQLAEGALYFGAGDGQFYAVQPETGKILWTYPLKAEGLAQPRVRAGVLYVLGGNNVAHALDAKTGKLLWVYNRREASNISILGGAAPAVAGDLVLFGFSDGVLVALNKSSGSVIWEAMLNRNKRFRDVDASPVVDGDVVYASSYDGALYAVALSDGKILWSVEDGGYDEVLISGTALYFSTTSGKTMALDKSSGKVLWSKDNPGGISTGPVLYKNVLLVGEMDGALRFLDARSGEPMAEFSPGRGVTSKAAVDAKSGDVYFMSHDANLFALKVNWKKYARDWPWE